MLSSYLSNISENIPPISKDSSRTKKISPKLYLKTGSIALKKCLHSEEAGDFSCSLHKLRLKFEETTRVVCTDFAEVLTLEKVQTDF